MPYEQRQTATGFLQFREVLDDGRKGRWCFQIYGFRGEPQQWGEASVYSVDGTRYVPIDPKDRIQIEGRWYGRNHWNH